MKTSTFENRNYLDKYLEIFEVLDDKIEVDLYSCTDINKYEIYVNYGMKKIKKSWYSFTK